MTASSVKGAIKGTLKGILNTAAPVFRRKSALDSASARETLLHGKHARVVIQGEISACVIF